MIFVEVFSVCWLTDIQFFSNIMIDFFFFDGLIAMQL